MHSKYHEHVLFVSYVYMQQVYQSFWDGLVSCLCLVKTVEVVEAETMVAVEVEAEVKVVAEVVVEAETMVEVVPDKMTRELKDLKRLKTL
jgi:hypothetical protein